MDTGFLFGGDKIFWNQAEVMVSHVNVLNATRLYTLKWLLLYYVNKKGERLHGRRVTSDGLAIICC